MENKDRDNIKILEKKLKRLEITLKEIKQNIDENILQFKILKENINRINHNSWVNRQN